MATYTTVRCPHCGYKIHDRAKNLPSLELGIPLRNCPECKLPVIEKRITEFEFLSPIERLKFTRIIGVLPYLLGNLLAFALGLTLMIGVIINGEDIGAIIFMCLIALFLCAISLYSIIQSIKAIKNKSLEKMVYKSLKRTQNEAYRNFIKEIYSRNKIRRKYLHFESKDEFLEKYSSFENEISYKDSMERFQELMFRINNSNQ